MVTRKQKGQTNHDRLTRKPAGHEAPIPPAKTLEFVAMQDSGISATTSGAQLSKALLNSALGTAQIFKST